MPLIAAVAIVDHSTTRLPTNGPSRAGIACGSVVDPAGVSRKTVSTLVGCIAYVAFDMNRRAGSACFKAYMSPIAITPAPAVCLAGPSDG